MGLVAFDLDINDTIHADKAIKKEKGRYICPSPDCLNKKVPVYLSEKQTGNCFVSYDKSQHDENCDFPTSYSERYHNTIPHNFSLIDIYNYTIGQKKYETNRKSGYNNNQLKNDKPLQEKIEIKSLYDLYRFCSSNDPTYTISNQAIQDFYISSSTRPYWYNKRCEVDNALVLIVGYTLQIFQREKRIRLVIDKDYPFKISITFEDQKEFEAVTAKIKEYNSNGIKMFVFGYASSQEYTFEKNNESITYIELSIKATENTIHFLSRKKNKKS